MPRKPVDSIRGFETAARAKRTKDEPYVLTLYVAGTTPGSVRAVEALRAFCDEHLSGRFELEVVDVYQQPVLARDEQIIALPTLVKRLPLPMRRILGDLSDKQRLLVGLDLKPKADEKARRTTKKKR